MPNECEKIRQEYEDLKSLKKEFDLEYEKALKTGNLEKAKELKAQLEQKRDALEEKLYTVDIVRISTERIINKLGLNLSFRRIDTEEVKGKKRIVVSFDFNSRLQGITDEAKREEECLKIVNDIVKVLTYRGNKIKGLNVGCNNIGDTGAKALAQALRNSNNKLEILDVRYNNIGSTGAEALAEALRDPNNKLEILNIWGNPIGDTGTKALVQARDEIKKEGKEIFLAMIIVHTFQ